MVRPDLANLVTMSRIFGVGAIFWLTPFHTEQVQLWTIVIYTVIAVTDFLDGWIARRFNIVSDLGKILDPLADKILVLVFLPLLTMGAISAFPVFLILAREFGIMALRVFAAKHGLIISANVAGKIKTGITLPVCGILMGRPEVILSGDLNVFWTPLVWLRRWVFEWPAWMFDVLIWAMVAVTIWSFLDYLFRFMWARHLHLADQDVAKAKKGMLAYIPNSVSFVNVLCGVASIISALNESFLVAGAFILIGMILDGLDGRIARKLGTSSHIGQTIDSNADYMTFGFSPAFLLFMVVSTFSGQAVTLYAWAISLAYVGAVRFRLKRFEDKGGHGDFFEGVPAPVGAAFVAVSVNCFFMDFLWVFLGVNVLNMGLMVSRFKYPHNHAAHRKWLFRHLRVPVLVFIGLVVLRYLGVESLDVIQVNHVLLGLMCVYYLAPVLPDRPAG